MKRGLVARSCARSGRKDVVGEIRTIATMCRQFHKLRWKTPRGKKVARTDGPVHTRKRACKGRARGAVGVGGRTIATTCRQFHKLR